MPSFEFIDEAPTESTVAELLEQLPPWFGGVVPLEYLDYVHPLPSTKTMGFGQDRRKHEVFTLYVTVPGRVQMANEAAGNLGLELHMVPEPDVSPPGMLSMAERIVYREYCEFRKDGAVLHRRPGMAWVPAEGGKNAAGSNPYEKVETAARGRAIAAYGLGVLPGSGIASLEEMLTPVHAPGEDPQPRKTRDDLLLELIEASDAVAKLRGMDWDEMTAKQLEFLQRSFNVDATSDDEDTAVEWSKVKDGQLSLMLREMQNTRTKLEAEQEGAS